MGGIMRLRNKKTGHIIECSIICSDENLSPRLIESNEGRPITLAELNEEWEDYEENKYYWYIDDMGIPSICSKHHDKTAKRKAIGNYFETREEAEKAEEKLKAWKRLKDKGFRFKDYTRKFDGFKRVDGSVFIVAELDDEGVIGMIDELRICFGGEE